MKCPYFEMLPIGAFRPVAGRMSLWKKDSDPPDYSQLAEASKEAAQIMADLGYEELDFTKQQYEDYKPAMDALVQQQIDIGNQTAAQGKDYYDYMVSQQRPVEEALNAEAMAAGSEEAQANAASQAMADARQGTTQQQNQMMRQGLRYGFSPEKMASVSTALANAQGLSVASAGNQARENEKNLGYAKKLDVAGLYRGLPGASQGAYSTALNAGNSAAQNTMAPVSQVQSGYSTAGNMIGSGQQMQLSGLGTILNSQTQMAMNDSQSDLGGIGSILGGAASLYKAFPSDRRLKENIVQVGRDEATGLPLYEFNYIDKPGQRYRGVMADDVEAKFPDAVVRDEDGYALVVYSALGIEMKEV